MPDETTPPCCGYGGLDDWEKALTLRVGTAYACRECGNLLMVTKGGVGVLDLVCCGKPMEMLRPNESQEAGQ